MPTIPSVRLPESEAPPKTGFTKQYDYDGAGNLIYEGFSMAVWGSATSAAQWAIKKNTYNGSNQLTASQWCNGSTSFLNVWTNRTSLSYQ